MANLIQGQMFGYHFLKGGGAWGCVFFKKKNQEKIKVHLKTKAQNNRGKTEEALIVTNVYRAKFKKSFENEK